MRENQKWILSLGLNISRPPPGQKGVFWGGTKVMRRSEPEGVKGVSDPSKGHPSRVLREGGWLLPEQQFLIVVRSDSGSESNGTEAKG